MSKFCKYGMPARSAGADDIADVLRIRRAVVAEGASVRVGVEDVPYSKALPRSKHARYLRSELILAAWTAQTRAMHPRQAERAFSSACAVAFSEY